MMFLVLSLMIGCKKTTKGTDTGEGKEGKEIVPASTTSQLRLVEVLPSVVDIGVRTEATVMGVGFTENSVLYIDDEVSVLDNVVYQGESVLEFTIPALSQGMHNLRVENPDGETHTLYGAIEADETSGTAEAIELLPPECAELVLYFSSANAVLDAPAKQLLEENAACFDNRYVYEVEGHCDERGTTEYNLSLGQRRAAVVEKFLLSQGILSDRVSTISYGEERPAMSGSSESAWEKNRRAVIRVKE